MIKQFPSTQSKNLARELDAMVALNTLFDALVNGKVPNEKYSPEALKGFFSDLVSSQRFGDAHIKDGFWSVCENLGDMHSDERDDFIHKPTYLAIAFLVYGMKHHPDLISDVTACHKAILHGLDFATLRGLGGHGYDFHDARRDALVVLTRGGVIQLLLEKPDFHPAFRALLSRAKAETDGILEAEQPIFLGPGHRDYRPLLTEIKGLLAGV